MEILYWLLEFLFVYLLYLFVVILNKKQLAKYNKSSEVRYLVYKYQIDLKQINNKKLAQIMALSNAFIIATTVSLASLVTNFYLKLLVGLLLLFAFIILVYDFVGKGIKRHEKHR